MVSSQDIFLGFCLVGALASLAIVLPVFRNRQKPGATGLLLAAPGASLFSLSIGLWETEISGWVGFFANNAGTLGAMLLTFGWLFTIAEHTETVRLTRQLRATAGGYIAVVQTLAVTNPYHQLFITPALTLRPEPVVDLPLSLNLVHILTMYAIGMAGCFLLLADIVQSSGTRRKQSSVLLAALAPPLLLNILFVFGLSGFNLTPLGFVLTTLGLWWALFWADFLDIVPVGRSRAVDSMGDPILTIDSENRVLDANQAARELAGVESEWEGTPVSVFFESFPELVTALRADDGDGTVTITHQGRQRDFSLTTSSINRQRGRVVVFREVTLLKERERQLDLLRQVQSRVLRHNIRNELDVIAAQNEVLAAELDGEYETMAETTLSSTDRLLSISSKARAVEDLVENDETPTTLDLAERTRTLVETYRETYPEVSFETDLPETCRVETLPNLKLALQNLVENAAEHNTAPEPVVDVTLTATDGEVVLTIADNGPGIPEQELAVREKRTETALEHGRGVGLWVVDWVVESTTATLSFDTGADGTAATLRLPRNRPESAQ